MLEVEGCAHAARTPSAAMSLARRMLALPALQTRKIAPHPLGIDLTAGQVHVGVGDQRSLVGRERHPLGEHVVGVGQARAAKRFGAVGELHAVLVEHRAVLGT